MRSKIDTSDDRGERNHLRITQTVPEERTGIARNERTAENRTLTAGSTNVEHKTYLTCEITLHVAQIVNTEQLQH